MTKRLFGTDGLRGVANRHPMTPEVCLALGRATAIHFRNNRPNRMDRPRVLIGRDTRRSGPVFEHALAAGIMSVGGDACLLGIMPTPGVAHLTRELEADAGLVISASHNPHWDNGVKVFDRHGHKLTDEAEIALEALLEPGAVKDDVVAQPAEIGRSKHVDDAVKRYADHLVATFPADLSLAALHIAVDCAHGAAYAIAPKVFEKLGATTTVIGAAPDGLNINHEVGATHPTRCAETVANVGADIGVTLDGDADRVALVDETGSVVDGDEILAICALAMKRDGRLETGEVVATVMSNIGLEVALKSHRISMARTRVGDRYVAEEMRRRGARLGGEQSGHIIFLDHATTGDGLVAALQVIAEILRNGRPLSELRRVMTRFPQVVVNLKVREKKPLDRFDEVQRTMKNAENALGKTGRVLVRYSGTEPKVRVMVEGENRDLVDRWAHRIAACIDESLNR